MYTVAKSVNVLAFVAAKVCAEKELDTAVPTVPAPLVSVNVALVERSDVPESPHDANDAPLDAMVKSPVAENEARSFLDVIPVWKRMFWPSDVPATGVPFTVKSMEAVPRNPVPSNPLPTIRPTRLFAASAVGTASVPADVLKKNAEPGFPAFAKITVWRAAGLFPSE